MADQRKNFAVEIICPDRVFFKGEVTMVELNTVEGEIGIYRNHVPTTCVLEPGIVTLHDDEGQREAAVHSGFIEILQDKVTILAEVAEWPEEIDSERAIAAKKRAEERLKQSTSGKDIMLAEASLKRALVRLDLAK